jgi:hypothetical protein
MPGNIKTQSPGSMDEYAWTGNLIGPKARVDDPWHVNIWRIIVAIRAEFG